MLVSKISGIGKKSIHKILANTVQTQNMQPCVDEFVSKPLQPKDLREFVKTLINNENCDIKNIWACFDWGRIGSPLWGFKKGRKLFNAIDKETSKITDCITCYLDKKNNLNEIYIYDCKNKTIRIFDKRGKMLQDYSSEETEAMLSYRHDSGDIHKVLRQNKKVKKQEEIEKNITHLSNIFELGKTSKTTGKTIVYRALDKHSLKAIMSMPENNGIIECPSFVSVATNKNKIYPFLNLRNIKHVMRIELPEGTPIIKGDEIGSVIILQPRETEWILNKGSKFIITNKKGYKGMIEAKYI